MSTLADRSADDHNDDLTRDRDEIARILVAGLAHDLHNQLGTILMTVGFTAGGGDQQAGRTGSALKMAKLAERSVEKAMALCDRIRQLPDIFTGEPMAVDTRHLVVGIEKKARTELADGVKLITSYDSDLRPLHGVPTTLLRVVRSLFASALDLVADDGEVRIEAGNTALDEAAAAELRTAAGEYVRLAASIAAPEAGAPSPESVRSHLAESDGSGVAVVTAAQPGAAPQLVVYLVITDPPTAPVFR